MKKNEIAKVIEEAEYMKAAIGVLNYWIGAKHAK